MIQNLNDSSPLSTRSCMITYVSKIFTSCCGEIIISARNERNQSITYKIAIKSIHFIIIGFCEISFFVLILWLRFCIDCYSFSSLY